MSTRSYNSLTDTATCSACTDGGGWAPCLKPHPTAYSQHKAMHTSPPSSHFIQGAPISNREIVKINTPVVKLNWATGLNSSCSTALLCIYFKSYTWSWWPLKRNTEMKKVEMSSNAFWAISQVSVNQEDLRSNQSLIPPYSSLDKSLEGLIFCY